MTGPALAAWLANPQIHIWNGQIEIESTCWCLEWRRLAYNLQATQWVVRSCKRCAEGRLSCVLGYGVLEGYCQYHGQPPSASYWENVGVLLGSSNSPENRLNGSWETGGKNPVLFPAELDLSSIIETDVLSLLGWEWVKVWLRPLEVNRILRFSWTGLSSIGLHLWGRRPCFRQQVPTKALLARSWHDRVLELLWNAKFWL